MAANKNTAKAAAGQNGSADERARSQEPDWANGLRKLYDSVVDEPLPDSFKDLLSQLDETNPSS